MASILWQAQDKLRAAMESCPTPDLVLALKANLAVMNSADAQIEILEKAVQDRLNLCLSSFLKTLPAPILLMIMLETGEIERFASVGNNASFCRCVGSKKSATASVKEAAIPKRQQVFGLGVLWTPSTLRFVNSRIKASIRKRNPRAMRLWP